MTDCKWPFLECYCEGPFERPSANFKWVCWAIAHTIKNYDLGGDKFARQKAHDLAVLSGDFFRRLRIGR